MFETVRIWIRGYKNEDHIRAHLRQAGIHEKEGEFIPTLIDTIGWAGEFSAADPRWPVLRDLARSIGDSPSVVQHSHPTEEELDAAELLLLECTPELLPKGDVGPDFGTAFDYEGSCPVCLSGARMLPPLRIATSALPRRRQIAESHAFDILVMGELAEALRGVAGSDHWLMAVESRKTGKLLPWVSLQPEVTLPPVDSATTGFTQYRDHSSSGGCQECGRDCWSREPPIERADGVEVILPKRLVYSAESVAGLRSGPEFKFPAIMGTWERCGLGTRPSTSDRRRIARPYLVVGQEIAKILQQHVSKYVSLYPIEIRK